MDPQRLPLAFSVLAATAFTLGIPLPAVAQDPPPVTFTADQDHQNMMDQLGIKALRPGPSGDEKAPNHANYDESKANPYPAIPSLLPRSLRPKGLGRGNPSRRAFAVCAASKTW